MTIDFLFIDLFTKSSCFSIGPKRIKFERHLHNYLWSIVHCISFLYLYELRIRKTESLSSFLHPCSHPTVYYHIFFLFPLFRFIFFLEHELDPGELDHFSPSCPSANEGTRILDLLATTLAYFLAHAGNLVFCF